MKRFLSLLVLVGMGIPAGAQSAGFSAPQVLAALAQAYAGRVNTVLLASEPALEVAGRRFVWAEGRLLPENEADRWRDLAPQPFYDYPAQVPNVAEWTSTQLAEAEQRLAYRQADAVRRDSRFFDAVWGCFDRKTAEENQRPVRFLGLTAQVHRLLVEPLARIEAKLTAARMIDPTLDSFLAGLGRLDGYNWRDIAGTQARSNHAYGTALDVIPRAYGGKNPYWLWAPQGWDGWYRLAWKRRWEPHPALVKAFEDEGFVWGGKWLLFDTIHFEYRPDILVLSGLR